eukprot:293404-Rhodomonas_salina.1
MSAAAPPFLAMASSMPMSRPPFHCAAVSGVLSDFYPGPGSRVSQIGPPSYAIFSPLAAMPVQARYPRRRSRNAFK